MSNKDNAPVVVIGEERRHPAIRRLARACIALARLRLEKQKTGDATGIESNPAPSLIGEEDQADG